jgi:hypothetical protein
VVAAAPALLAMAVPLIVALIVPVVGLRYVV